MFLIALFQEARHYEENGRSEDGLADLYRQVDTQDFVFAEKAPSSTRGVAPPRRKRLAAHAHQNSSQPRIHRINRQAGDEIEGGCCRIFLDPSWVDNHRSAQRNVPLGKTTPQASEC
jgi:hypothetical protein